MALKRKTAPAPVIDLAEAKAWLRVTSSDQDAVIQRIINSVTEWLDGPEGVLGACILSQTWEYFPDAFPVGDLEIPTSLGKVISVDSIEYKDPSTGNYAVWSNTNYTVDTVSRLVRASISWPTPKSDVLAPIRITVIAGLATAADAIPAPIIEAMLMMIVDRFDNRAAVNADKLPVVVPMGVESRIAPFRRIQF